MTQISDKSLRDSCQLMSITDCGCEPLHWYLYRRVRNLLRRFRRFLGIRQSFEQPIGQASRGSASPIAVELNTGDRVRVRSLEEIVGTFDRDGACRGCAFLKPMAAYCGREVRVARRVDHFFDERQWRMLKCRNIVLLEDAYCDGSGHPDTRGCERMCFFFWRTEWLEKID